MALIDSSSALIGIQVLYVSQGDELPVPGTDGYPDRQVVGARDGEIIMPK
jgi:hypothetical protein